MSDAAAAEPLDQPRNSARARQRRTDRWFRELGLPTFVPLRRWFTDLPRRVAPLVAAVTIVAFLGGGRLDDAIDAAVDLVPAEDEWIVFAAVIALLLLVLLLAWGGFLLVRAAMRRLSPLSGRIVAAVVILLCLAWLLVGGYLLRPHAVIAPMMLAGGVILACALVTGMGGGALLAWGARLAVRNASAVGHMASIALPVILMLVVFAFFSAEVWQMASALDWGSIALVGLVVAALATLVVLRVCASEIDDIRSRLGAEERRRLLEGTPLEATLRDPADTTDADTAAAPGRDPAVGALSRVQRANLLLVMAVAQLMQALLFAGLIWVLLTLIGGIAVPIGVVELWVGPGTPEHPLSVDRIVIGGATLPLTVNLVKATALLSIISALPFVLSAVSEERYRERFFDPIMVDLRRAVVVRDALIAEGAE